MAENNQPVFSIEKLYVKDLSLEVPGAPQIFLEREAPQINVQLRTSGQAVYQDFSLAAGSVLRPLT